jgi:arylsulfatase A-like enzyme
MQQHAPEAVDLARENAQTLEAYGLNSETTQKFGRRLLMARRLVERGVRFVQIYTRGQMWDNHANIGTSLQGACDHTDQPVAALLKDLKQRGLLKDTLVIWGGEFGRLPIAQIRPGMDPKKAGRDHGPAGFSIWMAGGGMKPGIVYGETDDIGYKAVQNRVSVNDWHATILHALGLHHHDLFFERNGLKDRLTGVLKPRVVKELFA